MSTQLALPLLSFEGKPVTPFLFKNQPALLASEVGYCLGLTDVNKALRSSKMVEEGTDYVVVSPEILPETESFSVSTLPNRVTILFESGLYALVLRSNKDAAIRFTRWVIREVLPEIRKTGAYAALPEKLRPESFSPGEMLRLMELERKGSDYARNVLDVLGLKPKALPKPAPVATPVGKEVAHG